MFIHIGASAARAMSPEFIGSIGGRFMNAFGERLLAGYNKKMAQVAARKPTPAAKARVAPKPTAKPTASPKKPMARSARLRAAEASVKATQPPDPRCMWRDMKVGR